MLELSNRADEPIAHGGEIRVELGWDIDTWEATPVAYRLLRRSPASV
jgi:hypothetical protein